MQINAYAKINLCLEILGRRSDGYHEVVSILHTIDIADRLTFELADSLTLQCDIPGLDANDNLVMRAALLLRKHAGFTRGANIIVEKRIPVASGLGGGSSDAAVTLRALNRLWDLNLDYNSLSTIASQLGSDVSFMVEGGCALVEGRGELITRLPGLYGWSVVVFDSEPKIPNKTAYIYEQLTDSDFSDGRSTRALALHFSRFGGSVQDVELSVGGFDRLAAETFAGLRLRRDKILECGATSVRLSGAGPSLYTLVDSQSEADLMSRRLNSLGYQSVVAELISVP